MKPFDHLRPEQTMILNSINMSDHPKKVLAAACGSGKTWMSIAYIISKLEKNPKMEILVLAHGTVVLLNNYLDAIEDYFDTFKYPKMRELFKKQVLVTLPQSYKKGKYDLIVVDEAHHFYTAGMLTKIFKHSPKADQLLLTGTPSLFNRNKKKFDIHYLPLFELDSTSRSNITFEIASTQSFKLNVSDLRSDGETNQNKASYLAHCTDAMLEELLTAIHKKLRAFYGKNSKMYSKFRKPLDWVSVFNTLEKTIFACHSIKMAKQVERFFESRDIPTLISTANEDRDSDSFKIFKESKEHKILIVVRKGVLGYDFPDLGTIVDLTMSYNLDRLHQLYTRLVRQSKVKKFYFKVTSPELANWMVNIMTASICLCHRHWMEIWDGKNFENMSIPIKVKRKKTTSKKGNNSKGAKKDIVKVEYIAIPDLKVFQSVSYNYDNVLSGYAFAKLDAIRREIFNMPNIWDEESALKEAKKYKTRLEFMDGSILAYGWLQGKGLLHKLDSILTSKRNNWNLELSLKEAKKYKTISLFKKNRGAAYGWLCRHNHLDKLSKILPSNKINWELKTAMKEAERYKYRQEFIKNSQGCYNWFHREGLLDELNKVLPSKTINWDLKSAKKEVKKYNTTTEFIKGAGGCYNWLKREGFLDKVAGKLTPSKRTEWDFKSAMKKAKEYKTRQKFIKNSGGCYNWLKKYNRKELDKLFPKK